MRRQSNGPILICGELLRGTSVAILQLLAKSDRPLTVPEIGNDLQEAYEDTQLYPIMKRLALSGKFVTASVVESNLRGHTQKRAAWEATPAVKEFFLRQEVTQ